MKLDLAGLIEGQDFGPDEDERGPQVSSGGLQQLEHIGEDAHRQRQVHRPAAHVQEAPQQNQRSKPVHLAQQHLRAARRHMLSAGSISTPTLSLTIVLRAGQEFQELQPSNPVITILVSLLPRLDSEKTSHRKVCRGSNSTGDLGKSSAHGSGQAVTLRRHTGLQQS